MTFIRLSRRISLPHQEDTYEVSRNVDPRNEKEMIRAFSALELAARDAEMRCPGCYVQMGIIHDVDCEFAPDDIIESSRDAMEQDLATR